MYIYLTIYKKHVIITPSEKINNFKGLMMNKSKINFYGVEVKSKDEILNFFKSVTVRNGYLIDILPMLGGIDPIYIDFIEDITVNKDFNSIELNADDIDLVDSVLSIIGDKKAIEEVKELVRGISDELNIDSKYEYNILYAFINQVIKSLDNIIF